MLQVTNSVLKQYLTKNRGNVRYFCEKTLYQRSEDDSPKDGFIIRKLKELNEWYYKFTGLNEVKSSQDRVLSIEQQFEKIQEERREIGKNMLDVQKRLSEVQEDLQNVKRYENGQLYLDFVKKETELIKLAKELMAKFDLLDKTERQKFISLSNAVRESYEKEKTQSEYTKYWGIILSVISTVIGYVGSSFISSSRNKQIVNGINSNVTEKLDDLIKIVESKPNSKELKEFSIIVEQQENRLNQIRKSLIDNQVSFVSNNEIKTIETLTAIGVIALLLFCFCGCRG